MPGMGCGRYTASVGGAVSQNVFSELLTKASVDFVSHAGVGGPAHGAVWMNTGSE